MPRLQFEYKFTLSGLANMVVMLVGLVALYYGLVGRADGQAKDIAVLQEATFPLPQMRTDITVLQNSLGSLQRRVDQNQLSVEAKLDKIVDGMSDLSSQVSGLNATLKAQGRVGS